MALSLALAAAPSLKQSSAVRTVFGGFPGSAVFGGALALDEVGGGVARSALVQDVVYFACVVGRLLAFGTGSQPTAGFLACIWGSGERSFTRSKE